MPDSAGETAHLGILRPDRLSASRSGRTGREKPGAGSGLREQAELAGAGDGLGAVGRAELAQQVADVLFHRVLRSVSPAPKSEPCGSHFVERFG